MSKKVLLVFICLVFLLSVFGCSETPDVSEKTESQSSTNSEYSSVDKENTGAPSEEELTAKAIWQDPNNIVIIWDSGENYEYSIYRSNHQNSGFEYIGKTKTGSYRDDTAKYPNEYHYKIKAKNLKTQKTIESESFSSIVAPNEIDSVIVIMYHNFVGEEDIKNGIEFDEYSISPSDFEQDLICLKENGYITITSAELLYLLENKEPIPEKAIILSIDDGSLGVYTNAWPLLKKYGMKADFNVIGAQIDAMWDLLHSGGTREGMSAPFCSWEELIEMQKSGEINICSHTYGMHVYDRENRVGMSMMENETAEEFAQAVKKDYNLALSCIEGWTGIMTETVAYPYSKRSAVGDEIVLNNTGYKILMAGDGARGTVGNYFVRGCDFADQLMLISRPCRMDGTPIKTYIERIQKEDSSNGVNANAPLS